MFGPGELNITLKNQIRVHVSYQTAFVDTDGKLEFRDDIYGRDSRLLAILHGGERQVADIAIDRPQQSQARPPVDLPYGVYADEDRWGRQRGPGGPNLFQLLFGRGG
jgi:hypothetical protein